MTSGKNRILGALALGMLIVALGGCQKEGPAEKAGKEIDKAMSSAGDQLQAASDKIQGAVK
jgi:hypothetical protein